LASGRPAARSSAQPNCWRPRGRSNRTPRAFSSPPPDCSIRRARWADLVSAAQRLIEAYPNRVEVRISRNGQALHRRSRSTISLYEKSIRLDPRDPNLFHRHAFLGFALLQVGRYEEARRGSERSLAANPEAPRPIRSARYRVLAIGYALSGRPDEAHRATDEANKLWLVCHCAQPMRRRPASAVLVRQISNLTTAPPPHGVADHADEDADFGVVEDEQAAARTSPGNADDRPWCRRRSRPPRWCRSLAERKPIVIDTGNYSWDDRYPPQWV